MNGRVGVCVGVEEARLLIKLDPVDGAEKAKTVKVKHKNIEYVNDYQDGTSKGASEPNGVAQVGVSGSWALDCRCFDVLKIVINSLLILFLYLNHVTLSKDRTRVSTDSTSNSVENTRVRDG
jgi:hypothetical protein